MENKLLLTPAEDDSAERALCSGCGLNFSPNQEKLHQSCGQNINLVTQANDIRSIWCVVGNIAVDIPFGPQREIRNGTKHFSGGTKIYCYPPLWDIWDGLQVIGRHRGSKRFVTMVIRPKWLVNFQVRLVYKPYIVNALRTCWTDLEESQKRAENLVEILEYWKIASDKREVRVNAQR